MHVCTCDNKELLGIEDRLEGVKRLYCENFAGCLPTEAAVHSPLEQVTLETSGLVYLRAVHEEVEKHHLLHATIGPPVPTPMLPISTTLAPRPARRLVAPLVYGILGLAFLAGGVSVVRQSAPGPHGSKAPLGAQGSVALVAAEPSSLEEAAPSRGIVPPVRSTPGPLAPGRIAQPAPPEGPAVLAPGSASRSRVVRRRRARAPKALPTPRATDRTQPDLAPERKPVAPAGAVAPPAPAPARSSKPRGVLAGEGRGAGATPGMGSQTLERMLKAATGKTGTVLPPPEKLPQRLGVKAITAAQSRVRRGAGHCLRKFGFTHRTARVRIRLRGDRGRVTWVGTQGWLRGTPVGRCIERAARQLRTPRFRQSRQVLTIPIRVH